MKLAIVGYVPPPTVGHPHAFLENLRRFKLKTDLLLYSDHPWEDTLRLKASPEVHRGMKFPTGEVNKFAVPNAAFFTGLRIAATKGYTHVLILEEDCRVGCDYWDQIMWEEYFSIGRPTIAAGTLACYNPCNFSPEATRRWTALIQQNKSKNHPIVTYGYSGAGQVSTCCVFPNGALAIYDLRWMAKYFDLEQSLKTAALATAWDMAIGYKIWETFQEDAYEVTGLMGCIFSGYGNVVTTQAMREEMLVKGEVVAVHQIKTDWKP